MSKARDRRLQARPWASPSAIWSPVEVEHALLLGQDLAHEKAVTPEALEKRVVDGCGAAHAALAAWFVRSVHAAATFLSRSAPSL